MKDFIQRLQAAIRKAFGEEKKPSEIQTDEEKLKLAKTYKDMWKSDLDKDFEAYQETKEKAKAYDSALSLISSEEDKKSTDDGTEGASKKEDGQKDDGSAGTSSKEDGQKEDGGQNQGNQVDLKEYIEKSEQEKKDLKAKLEKLEQQVEPDETGEKKVKIGASGFRHSNTHLFGIEHSMFSRDKRWNEIMANPRVAQTSDPDEDKDFKSFQDEVRSYGKGLSRRMQQLHSEGRLNLTKEGALNVDYSDLTNADLGDQFVVRRQDALIARILMLPDVTDIFPRRYGVQDKELITNAFLGDFSQPYQSGEVWKGSIDLQPEMGHVDDAMFKTLFESMKWLERRYIGYLNQEGSDPVKWTMIEWTILRIAEKLKNEQRIRRIIGIGVEPISGTAYHYLHGSTGVIYTLIRYINQFKLNPFDDAGLSSYDNASTNFVDAVIAFKDKLAETLEFFDESQYEMLLNAKHRHWYKDQYRSKYGTDNDFTQIIDSRVPDSEMPIRWVPNMGNLKFIIVQEPGNIQLLENLPGEMFDIKFQQDMENVKSWSVWKEGVSAAFVGKKFTSRSALESDNYKNQRIFMNKPVKELDADDTTPDVSDNFWIQTVANDNDTDITDLDNKQEGKAYIIECGSTTKASTVTASDLFSEITDDWTPTDVGDYLMVIWDDNDSKFYELERMVGGTRTVNTDRQPTLASA